MSTIEYPCLDCSSAVEDHHEAVACNSCDGWQHIRCNTGISRRIYRRMQQGLTTRRFICIICQHDQTPMETDAVVLRVPTVGDASISLAADLTNEVEMRNYNESDDDVEAFNISIAFQRPDELEESAIEDPEPTTDIVQSNTLIYEVVEGATLKGGDMLLNNRGYGFTRKRDRENVTYWWCSHRSLARRCPATVIQRGDTFKTGRHQHDHPADPGMKHRIKMAKQVKLEAQTNLFVSAKTLVETAFHTQLSPDDFNLPNQTLLTRRANRSRQKLRPAEPRGEDFELAEYALPEEFLRHDVTTDGARHLIFSTETQIEVLKNAKRWYVDGTFKVLRKNDPFTQLYSIHAFIKNDDGEAKQFPLLFVFMSRRRKKDYKKVFKKVKSLTEPASVQGFVMDFEWAAWAAIRRVFPQTKVSGCAFHWSQAVWRKVQNLGLACAYQEDEGTHLFVRKLLALPLLPQEHISPAFEILQQKATDQLQPLMDYVQSTWITGTWVPTDWSVFGQSIRTNNDCEGWHRRLNFRTNGPPPFYSLVDHLYTESMRLTHQMRLVSERKLQKQQKKTARSIQKEIFKVWEEYREHHITTSRLLKKLSRVYGPVQ